MNQKKNRKPKRNGRIEKLLNFVYSKTDTLIINTLYVQNSREERF